jgi:hypothetical protein
MRAIGVTIGILLQPYRHKKIKNKVLSEIVKRRFIYQDNLYGGEIDLLSYASKSQIFLAKIFWFGAAIFFTTIILVLIHNFFLYPEFAKARMAR